MCSSIPISRRVSETSDFYLRIESVGESSQRARIQSDLLQIFKSTDGNCELRTIWKSFPFLWYIEAHFIQLTQGVLSVSMATEHWRRSLIILERDIPSDHELEGFTDDFQGTSIGDSVNPEYCQLKMECF